MKLPVNRKKKKKKIFFSLLGWQFLLVVKSWFCNFLVISSGFVSLRRRVGVAAPGLQDGPDQQHRGGFSSFLPPHPIAKT